MSVSAGSYLRKNRHNIYYFRRWVPLDLRSTDGPPEICFSLRTSDLRVATRRGRLAWAATETEFARLRHMKEKMSVVRVNLDFGMELGDLKISCTAEPHEVDSAIRLVEGAIKASGMSVDAVSGKLRDSSEKISMLEAIGERAPSSPRMDDAIERFCTAHKATWSRATMDSYRDNLGQLCVLLDNPYVSELTKERLRNLLDLLVRLPPNINKSRVSRGKSVEEILALNLRPQASKTVKKKWETLSGLLKWLKGRGETGENHAVGMTPRAVAISYDKFSDSDLRAIFGAAPFSTGIPDESFHYWVPLLGLYTGARLEELCQLHLADVGSSDGVPFIHVTDENLGEDDAVAKKAVKTGGSVRRMPIHPDLIELGFLRFVEQRRREHSLVVFPELKVSAKGKRSERASAWFTKFRRAQGVGASEQKSTKTFHSFRHTLNARLQSAGVPQERRERLVGHMPDSINVRVYGGDFPMSMLLEDIKKFESPIKPAVWSAPADRSAAKNTRAPGGGRRGFSDPVSTA